MQFADIGKQECIIFMMVRIIEYRAIGTGRHVFLTSAVSQTGMPVAHAQLAE